jgi:hypothetical protein
MSLYIQKLLEAKAVSKILGLGKKKPEEAEKGINQMESYKKIGYILAEALGLTEARKVHVVGARRERRNDPSSGRVTSSGGEEGYIQHGIAGEPGTGKGGKPRLEVYKDKDIRRVRPRGVRQDEAKAASRELKATKGTEDSPITGKETRFVPTSAQEKSLSSRAKLKLASHRKRLASRTQDVADDAEEQSKKFRAGSSMKDSTNYQQIGRKLFENKMKELKASYERVHGKPATKISGKTAGSKASDALERNKKTPDKFDKKVNNLLGKKTYSTQTNADMWREIHGNAKKGLKRYTDARDAQLKKDEEGD